MEKIKTKRLSFLPALLDPRGAPMEPRGGGGVWGGQGRFSLLRVQLSFSSHRTTERRQRRLPHNPLLPRPWQLHCEKLCSLSGNAVKLYTGSNQYHRKAKYVEQKPISIEFIWTWNWCFSNKLKCINYIITYFLLFFKLNKFIEHITDNCSYNNPISSWS